MYVSDAEQATSATASVESMSRVCIKASVASQAMRNVKLSAHLSFIILAV